MTPETKSTPANERPAHAKPVPHITVTERDWKR